MSDNVLVIALRVAHSIEQVGGRYFLGGSLASSLDGDPRATNDIDFVVDLPLGRVSALKKALGGDFELDEDMLLQALQTGGCANAFYLPTVLKVDFFGHAHGPFDDSEFERRREVQVEGIGALFVKSPEDSVLRKLLWFRAGGGVSERQWRDVLGVISHRHDTLDRAYLRRWSQTLQLSELLCKAWNEATGGSFG